MAQTAPQSTSSPQDTSGSVPEELGTPKSAHKTWQEAFNSTIRQAIRTGPNYDRVAVLLVSWADYLDEDLKCMPELRELSSVFQEYFGFSTSIVSLDGRRRPQVQLTVAMNNLILQEDGPNSLLIVYYSGHGAISGDGLELRGSLDLMKSSVDKFQPRAQWDQAESALITAEADVLTIMDCCFAGSIHKGAYSQDGRLFELLAAAGPNTSTPAPGPRSFTRSLINSLLDLGLSGEPFSTFDLNSAIMRRSRNHNSHLFSRIDRPTTRFICLTPLSAQKQPLVCSPSSSLPTVVLRIQFANSHILQSHEGANIAFCLAKAVRDGNLNAKTIECVGITTQQQSTGKPGFAASTPVELVQERLEQSAAAEERAQGESHRSLADLPPELLLCATKAFKKWRNAVLKGKNESRGLVQGLEVQTAKPSAPRDETPAQSDRASAHAPQSTVVANDSTDAVSAFQATSSSSQRVQQSESSLDQSKKLTSQVLGLGSKSNSKRRARRDSQERNRKRHESSQGNHRALSNSRSHSVGNAETDHDVNDSLLLSSCQIKDHWACYFNKAKPSVYNGQRHSRFKLCGSQGWKETRHLDQHLERVHSKPLCWNCGSIFADISGHLRHLQQRTDCSARPQHELCMGFTEVAKIAEIKTKTRKMGAKSEERWNVFFEALLPGIEIPTDTKFSLQQPPLSSTAQTVTQPSSAVAYGSSSIDTAVNYRAPSFASTSQMEQLQNQVAILTQMVLSKVPPRHQYEHSTLGTQFTQPMLIKGGTSYGQIPQHPIPLGVDNIHTSLDNGLFGMMQSLTAPSNGAPTNLPFPGQLIDAQPGIATDATSTVAGLREYGPSTVPVPCPRDQSSVLGYGLSSTQNDQQALDDLFTFEGNSGIG